MTAREMKGIYQMVEEKVAKKDAPISMEQLVAERENDLVPFKENSIVECTIISVSSHKVLCDVCGLTYGFVPEKEFSFDTKELKPGDKVTAAVVSMENRDGYIVLSLRRADKDKLWRVLNEKREEGSLVEIKVVSANRGGLMVEAGGIQGFLPVSQLSGEHYPRVDGGDPNQILQKLRQMIGVSMTVKILTADKEEEKLIFSEKLASSEVGGGVDTLFEIGQEIEGKITGIAHFGLFVNLKSMEGLVHISEVSWDHVEDLNKLFSVGQTVKAKVVKIEDGKVSLSIKRMQADPWLDNVKKIKVGQKIEGEVTKVTAYGAFVRLGDGLDGLVHASGDDIDKVKALANGEKHNFEIIELKPESRRIGLRLVA
jgi:small subunit ribosomal protein S1